MLILTGQDKKVLDLLLKEEVLYPTKEKINHEKALPCYLRLFQDYNEKKGTDYETFFWGFSRILPNEAINFSEEQLSRSEDMIKPREAYLLLDIPEKLLLETNFYYFADEIFTADELNITGNQVYYFPKEKQGTYNDNAQFLLLDNWHTIYQLEELMEVQVIFPFLKKEWLIDYKIV